MFSPVNKKPAASCLAKPVASILIYEGVSVKLQGSMARNSPVQSGFSSVASRLKCTAATALDAVFPPRCAGCLGWMPGNSAASGARLFCDSCEAALPHLHPPLCVCCGHPDELRHPTRRCPDCRAHLPAFKALRSLYDFEGGAREAIHALKYNRTTAYAPLLAARLAALFDEAPIPRRCLLVPVPLHPWRRWRRGFNQSELLAAALAGVLGGAPQAVTCVPTLLRRARWTTSQVELDESHRAANVRGAFIADAALLRALPRLPIVLVDDVATTGATLDECARALHSAGAVDVFAVTIARKL